VATSAATPADLYMSQLSAGSQGMRQCLEAIAEILDPRKNADTYPWHELTYRDSMTVRQELVRRYKPSTVNKTLSALRGVLKQAWRLGLLDADAYHRAADVENVRASTLLSGRALEPSEIRRLFQVCTDDDSPKGARDAAIFAVFYGCGLRRTELVRLTVDDFDPEDCSIVVNGKRRKQRTVYLTESGCRLINEWLEYRGTAAGPLFCPVRQTGEVEISPLRGESVAYILRRRQEEAGIEPFSPHDLRRTFVTTLLDAGEDVLTVQRLAGHADVSTTARYDRRGEGAKRRAVQALALPCSEP
jgi:site-specific recombinase XerD